MSTRSYDPNTDLDQLSPRWSIHVTDLDGDDEVFLHAKHKVLIDPTRWGESWMRAHVAAHLTLCHHLEEGGGCFTEQQERAADALARGRIVLAETWGSELFELPPIDGEPSIPFSALA